MEKMPSSSTAYVGGFPLLWNGDGTWIQENIAVHLLGLQYMGMSVDQDVSLA